MRRRSASRRPSISIVGPGNLGSALAETLFAAGYEIESLVIGARSKSARRANALARKVHAKLVRRLASPSNASIVWITVPDDAIADVSRELASAGEWKGKIALHSSGALTCDELEPLRASGARVASVHPMMTFVRGTVPEMTGVAFALEGDTQAITAARAIVSNLGGKPFVIRKENKVLYHVFGSFASPLVIALMASMEEVALAAGIRRKDIREIMLPLLRQTWSNYLVHGAEAAFTGPMARGDIATVRKHLRELRRLPQAQGIYRALLNSALNNLPVKNAAEFRS